MNAPASDRSAPSVAPWRRSTWVVLIATLSLLTFLVAGYHPYAEDGGMYLARVLALLHPGMFVLDAGFVREPLRVSLFAPLLIALCRVARLPLAWVLLTLNLAAIAALLASGRELLRRCISSERAQLAGIALLGAWATMPIAATSLMLTDPYVTARSFSTPLTLLALAFALDEWQASATTRFRRPAFLCAASLAAAFAFHPLMAVYAAVLVLLLRLIRRPHPLAALATLMLAAMAMAAAMQALAPADSPAVVAADVSRYYWFLSQWHWYEIIGLVAPLAVIASLTASPRLGFTAAAHRLTRAATVFAVLGCTIALLFAHENFRSHFVARFQPLRVYCLIYALLPLLLGAALEQSCRHAAQRRRAAGSRRSATLFRVLPATVIVASAIGMFAVQRSTFPASGQLELPWQTENPNPWVRAFVWIRGNTPPNAVFAMEARYVNIHGEDAQIFRAIAQRSALPDFSKDGGEASQLPQLAAQWQQAAAAQQQLSAQTDALRDARLQPLGATWMLLLSSAHTAHPCLYDNGTVKVCELER